VWNQKSVVVNRIYITLLGLCSFIGVFAIYLAIHAVSNFFDDRRILDGEMKIQQDIKHQFWLQTNDRKVDKWTDEELRFYLGDLGRVDTGLAV
jgi:hypothetical protein